MKNWKIIQIFAIILGGYFLLAGFDDLRCSIFGLGAVAIVTGKLNIVENPRDPDLGITANSFILVRNVERFYSKERKNSSLRMEMRDERYRYKNFFTSLGLVSKRFYAKISIGDGGLILGEGVMRHIKPSKLFNTLKKTRTFQALPVRSDPQIEKKYALYSKGDYYTDQKDHDVIMNGDYRIQYRAVDYLKLYTFTVVGKIKDNVIGADKRDSFIYVGKKTLSEINDKFMYKQRIKAIINIFFGLSIIFIALYKRRKNAKKSA